MRFVARVDARAEDDELLRPEDLGGRVADLWYLYFIGNVGFGNSRGCSESNSASTCARILWYARSEMRSPSRGGVRRHLRRHGERSPGLRLITCDVFNNSRRSLLSCKATHAWFFYRSILFERNDSQSRLRRYGCLSVGLNQWRACKMLTPPAGEVVTQDC